MKKFLIILALIVVAIAIGAYFFLFGKKDVCKNVIPEDAKAVLVIDAKQALKQMDFSISDIFKALKHRQQQKEEDKSGWGIDMLSPMYGFVSADNYVCGVFALSNPADFEDKLKEENITVESQRGFKWANKGEILLCFDSEKALALGPVTMTESDRMRGKMVEWMKQGSHNVPVLSSLKNNDGVLCLRSSLDVLPEAITEQFNHYLNNVELDKIFLNVTLNVREKAFVLSSELDSQDDNLSKCISEFDDFLRPIDDGTFEPRVSNPMAQVFFNVQGEKLLIKLRENPFIRMFLVAVNLCVDTDMMIKAIDGNVSIEIGGRTNRGVAFLMNAKVMNQDFLKNAKDWCTGGSTLGYSCQAFDDKNFVLQNGGQKFFFGVDGDFLYLSSLDRNSSVFSASQSGNNFSPVREHIVGKRYYASVDVDKVYNFVFGYNSKEVENPAGLDRINIGVSDLSHFQIEFTTKVKTTDFIKKLLK